jgi:hypothetical protein
VKKIRALQYLLIAAAAGVWILNVAAIASLFSPFQAQSLTGTKPGGPIAAAIDAADSALRCRHAISGFEYRGNFEAPFRLVTEAFAPPVTKKNASPAPLRVDLILKGVLMKDQPLAILENGKGATVICGIGEKVQDFVVESIEASHVQLRGPQGAVTLSVKE